ncbi:MAG: Golgi mannosyltransferase complex subunit [Watsoniomyces obsoletus]|nr:MAG: Golgi mannosyltransferase complex subunit [Watsoniomyces obsoletus]
MKVEEEDHPDIKFSHLNRADGSATYSKAGFTIIGAVNGPVEAQRRDELAEEAVIEVTVRQASGFGGPDDRHLESTIHSTLRHIILVQNFPRMLIQVTLQVVEAPKDKVVDFLDEGPTESNLPLLHALLQTTMLAVQSAAIPLTTTFTSFLVANVMGFGIEMGPDVWEMEQICSLHVLGMTSDGKLLVDSAEGVWEFEVWELVIDAAKAECCPSAPHTKIIENGDYDGEMEVDVKKEEEEENMGQKMKDVVKREIQKEQKWKQEI